ncbi:ABC transporter permease subunit [Fertoebacter nigrum]|uniref:ABC transporter permease subunit n=1 Tax=Fertoeibacter niger TaxID=2656921 RepID=A0A8X8H2Q1_9RHOB|nr:ABC transporter permease subunit [Fertoeibacter niger]NUB44498.1 ABC transporter permease subunit [Fertoeibacter niger]
MAIVADVPKDGFRLSMLIYDTRFRSITIQVVVLILFLLGVAWLVNNTVENLAAKDKDIAFGFLWNRAGYDIGQTLVPYTNDSSHIRAALVGLVNTLVLAFFGCIFATILGVFAGVLRLSNNWIVGRLMTVYVEIFRNIPLLLWIILVYVVLSETLPTTADFRQSAQLIADGLPPTVSMSFGGTVALTNQGLNVPAPFFARGLGQISLGGMTISLNTLLVFAVVIGSFLANRALRRNAAKVQEATGLRPVIWWKSLLILFAPIILVCIALGLSFDVPVFGRFNFAGGISIAHAFTAMLVALSLYTGAFIAEAVRSGIMAISRGQSEAAFALGLQPGRTMKLIILPQALRIIIPPLISQYLNLTKNTSLGIAVSYLDLRGTLGGITLNQTGRELECMLLMMLIYLIISLIISSLMNLFNSAVKLKER